MPLAIDLFAGCGGLTSGLRAAGFDVLAAVEKDPDAAASYAANHPDVLLFENDIRELAPKLVLARLPLQEGDTVDLIAGCPPCQGFTRLTDSNGKRDPRNGLVRDYLRFVEVIRPKVCMLENVPGLLRKGRRHFGELRRGLERAGYSLTYRVVELADYGVPQFRKRLVLLGSRIGDLAIPPPTHAAPDRTSSKRRPWRTVADAIAFLSSPPRRSEVRSGTSRPAYPWHYSRDVAPVVEKRLAYASANGRRRASLPPSLRLACHERRPDGYNDVYGVIDWHRPSPTITSGCTNASKGCFGHPSEPRALTATEAAVLQTFPVGYKFRGTGLESVATQIGNALPRHFARIMGRAIAAHLAGSGRPPA